MDREVTRGESKLKGKRSTKGALGGLRKGIEHLIKRLVNKTGNKEDKKNSLMNHGAKAEEKAQGHRAMEACPIPDAF